MIGECGSPAVFPHWRSFAHGSPWKTLPVCALPHRRGHLQPLRSGPPLLPHSCADQARRTAVRAAGCRYQASRRGRHAHAERQRRYRAKPKKVTHQGSPPWPHRFHFSLNRRSRSFRHPGRAVVAIAPCRTGYAWTSCAIGFAEIDLTGAHMALTPETEAPILRDHHAETLNAGRSAPSPAN